MTYTAGELAKKLGVTARTVRFYDEKNLLPPRSHSEAGYRLYDDESAERLQKILMLRFMDFSIEQIAEMMKEDHFDVKESLEEQERLLTEKKEHIERILAAVRKTKEALAAEQKETMAQTSLSANPSAKETENGAKSTAPSGHDFWENMRRIIEITRQREYIIAQYGKADNLSSRISLHDYSTSPVGFYPWMLEKIALAPNMKVLDIGCGNAAFWRSIAAALPENLEVHLVDYSDGMLAATQKNMEEIQALFPEKNLRYVLDKRDATDFSYPVSGFDRIMANHVLFHLNREARAALYPKINRLLKDGGRFSCSLIGKTHLLELHAFVRKYYPEIIIPSHSFDIWLEDAAQELSRNFNVLETEEQENDLLVPDEEAIFDYIASYSSDARETIRKDRELFLSRVRGEMNSDGFFYIHKSTGLVICGKK